MCLYNVIVHTKFQLNQILIERILKKKDFKISDLQ